MIIGKTNIESNDYNCLVFCVRNIKDIIITDSIKQIISSITSNIQSEVNGFKSFNYTTIPNFIKNICSYAFAQSLIKSIIIPNEVIRIGKGAFCSCYQLQHVDFLKDSKLQIIDAKAFYSTSIEIITIQSGVIRIGKSAFRLCRKLKGIKFAQDSKLQIIEKKTFFSSSIESIAIPSEVRRIENCAFSNCSQLRQIVIEQDSKLQVIEEDAFSSSLIESLTIPSSVVDLQDGLCSYTSKLTKINMSQSNPRYRLLDNKMIIGKTNIESNDYDCLVFVFEMLKISIFLNLLNVFVHIHFQIVQLNMSQFQQKSEQ